MNKDFEKACKRTNEALKRKMTVPFGIILGMVILIVVLSGMAFYLIGYHDKTTDILMTDKQEQQQQEEYNLMRLPVGIVYDTFLKYLMVKTMLWLPWILGILGAGWVIHGLF